MGTLKHSVGHSQVYTMRQLNQDTAGVIRQINEAGVPAAITRSGRFVALITPLANERVEGAVLDALLQASDNEAQLRGKQPIQGARSLEDVAKELGVNLP